jgi:hypothetical protein
MTRVQTLLAVAFNKVNFFGATTKAMAPMLTATALPDSFGGINYVATRISVRSTPAAIALPYHHALLSQLVLLHQLLKLLPQVA